MAQTWGYSAANLFSRMPRPSIVYLDAVTGLNGAYSCGSSGGDEVAGLEGHGGGDVTEEIGDGEDEVAGGALLLDDAVEAGDDGDGAPSSGVDLVGDDGADGAEGVEALAAASIGRRSSGCRGR